MSLDELRKRTARSDQDLLIIDVRERDAYTSGHVPGTRLLPRGQLELRVNEEQPDPTRSSTTDREGGVSSPCCHCGH